jgi:fatty-acyl-CoA synthase
MLQPGLMMDRPLLISAIIEHAAAQYANVDVVSRETHGPVFRYTWSGCAKRSRKLANALASLGLGPGSAVGSIAWNNHRHLEAYFAVSGSGMVMHTCNPRLQPQQLIYVINHAEDAAVIFDATFAPLIKGIAAHCPKVKHWICLADAEHTPAIEGVDVVVYEDLRRTPKPCNGPTSTNTPAPRFATPRAPREIPRACCIRIAPWCSTR